MEHSDFDKVRASVQQQCGSEVVIQLDRGRNKVDIQKGVIQEAYPSVFTILVNDESDESPAQLLSFSYTDIITKEIRMKLC
ncbi:MAG: Veg family protein [Lachnospiraceae bacterium]|nr:Veg family protein [Lachnospiraceae bacterium]